MSYLDLLWTAVVQQADYRPFCET